MGTVICLFLLGFAYLFTGKMGFGSLGLGLTNNKMGMGTVTMILRRLPNSMTAFIYLLACNEMIHWHLKFLAFRPEHPKGPFTQAIFVALTLQLH